MDDAAAGALDTTSSEETCGPVLLCGVDPGESAREPLVVEISELLDRLLRSAVHNERDRSVRRRERTHCVVNPPNRRSAHQVVQSGAMLIDEH